MHALTRTTSQRQTLEQEQRSETVTMEMVSAGAAAGVGQAVAGVYFHEMEDSKRLHAAPEPAGSRSCARGRQGQHAELRQGQQQNDRQRLRELLARGREVFAAARKDEGGRGRWMGGVAALDRGRERLDGDGAKAACSREAAAILQSRRDTRE